MGLDQIRQEIADGQARNGTRHELEILAEMLIPLDGAGKYPDGGQNYTCRHYVDARCQIYDRRPVVCRIYPSKGQTNGRGICDARCTLQEGQPSAQAIDDFRKAMG